MNPTIQCPNPECSAACGTSDIIEDTCRHCGVPNEALATFAQAQAQAQTNVDDDDDQLEDGKPEFPCEACQVKPRLRTLPYCEDCALEQGCNVP